MNIHTNMKEKCVGDSIVVIVRDHFLLVLDFSTVFFKKKINACAFYGLIKYIFFLLIILV